jgi:hypothetical protein
VRDWEGQSHASPSLNTIIIKKRRKKKTPAIKCQRHRSTPALPTVSFFLFSFQMSDMAIEYKTKIFLKMK